MKKELKLNVINPIGLRHKELYDNATYKQQLEYDEFDEKTHMKDELLEINRTRKDVKIGDFFAIQAKKGMYFYGRVLDVIDTDDEYQFNGGYVVCIYNHKTDRLELDNNFKPNYEDLLVNPSIVIKQCWTLGYFYPLGYRPLTDE